MISFKAHGLSMDPLIRELDTVFVQPIEKEKIRLGDILFYKTKRDSINVAHRLEGIAEFKGEIAYIMQGDFILQGKGSISHNDILGKVVGVKRDSKVISLESLSVRILKLIWNIFPLTGRFIFTLLRWRSIYFKVSFLINPRFFIKSPPESLVSIKEKFNQKEEIDFCSQYVKEGIEDWEELIVRRFMPIKNAHILDIACGAGREAIALRKLGFQVTGIDISEGMIKEAKKNAEERNLKIRFEAMSASEINFPQNLFDHCLFSRNTYSFIPSRPLRVETLIRIKKCLKPCGLIFLSPYIIKRRFFHPRAILDMLRRVRNFIFPGLFLSEAGDVWMRGVSPVSRVDKFCFCHYFRSKEEILSEIRSAGLKFIDSGIDNVFIAKNE